jgi:hypothetical protein
MAFIQLCLKSSFPVLKLALLLIGSSVQKSLFGLTSYIKALKKDYTNHFTWQPLVHTILVISCLFYVFFELGIWGLAMTQTFNNPGEIRLNQKERNWKL